MNTFIGCCIAAAFSTGIASADELRTTQQDQSEVAVTIYNDDLALVKDQRKVTLNQGLNQLAFRDVSAQIQPETALLRSLSAPGSLSILEQNFDFDLLSPEKLLEKYVGKTVSIIKTNPATGAESTEQAQVLSANNGVVLKLGDRIETGIPGRIVYKDLPENLRDRPTLALQLQNKTAGNQTLELSYLTGGLSWKADYVAELNGSEDKLDLSGLITLNNTSGSSYRNAKLQLVAGDVNRIQEIRPLMMKDMRAMAAEPAATVTEESLLEYHLYTIPRPTTIAENQTKQVALLSAANVPVRKYLILQGADYYYRSPYGEIGRDMKIGVFMDFDNRQAASLGIPLPKGVIRVYKKDASGNAQFVGEDRIDHTARNETVRLKLGNAFDVKASKKQTDFKKLSSSSRDGGTYESAFEITLKNGKKENVTVMVQEPIPGDWKILQESQPSTKESSTLASWKVEVPAEGQAVLKYRTQVKY